jgi:hypothetical protein
MKNKWLTDFVENGGQAVRPAELAAVKEEFVDVGAYHHSTISRFYGGNRMSQINFELIKDDSGQYRFNR